MNSTEREAGAPPPGSETGSPPALVRLVARVMRRLPRFRGRSRIEKLIHERLMGNNWAPVVDLLYCKMRVSLDDLVGRTIYLRGKWERHNTEIARRIIKRGAVVFDVGANVGYYTLLFASLVRDRGVVYAFEPVGSTYRNLKNNLSMNAHLEPVIRPVQLAVSDSCHAIEIRVAVSSGQSYIWAGRSESQTTDKVPVAYSEVVRTTTLDDFWYKIARPEVALIKMDIEGHELHALRGMANLLGHSTSLILMVEVRDSYLRAAGGSSAELFQLMYAFGYRCFEPSSHSLSWKENRCPHNGELVLFSRSVPGD